MTRKVKWAGGFVVLAGIVAQFFQPDRGNPPVEEGADMMAANAPPPQIAALLHSACYDCHSYETRWPWYTRVSPVSWFIADHVNDGRDRMNFSEWPHDDASRIAKRLKHIADEVESGEMPLKSYSLIHSGARLTSDQRKELVDWARKAAASPEH